MYENKCIINVSLSVEEFFRLRQRPRISPSHTTFTILAASQKNKNISSRYSGNYLRALM